MDGRNLPIEEPIYEFGLNDEAYVPFLYDSGMSYPSATALFCQDRLFDVRETIDTQQGAIRHFLCGTKYGYSSVHVEQQMIDALEDTIIEQLNQSTRDMQLTMYASYSPCAYDHPSYPPNCRSQLIDFVNRINRDRAGPKFRLCIVFSAFFYVPRQSRNSYSAVLDPKLQAGKEGIFELQNHKRIDIGVFTRKDWSNLVSLINRWNNLQSLDSEIHTHSRCIMVQRYAEDGVLQQDLWMLLAKTYCSTIIEECGNEFQAVKTVVDKFKTDLNDDYKVKRMLRVDRFVDELDPVTSKLAAELKASRTAAHTCTLRTVFNHCRKFTAFLVQFEHLVNEG